jgi:rsbT co-antagonist protein RsbR
MKSDQHDKTTVYVNGANLTATHIAELQQQVLLYTQVVEQISDGVYIFHLEDRNDDRSLRFITANAATEALTNVAPQRIIGQTLDDAFPNLRQHGIPQAYAEVVRTGQPFQTELVYSDEHVIESAFAIKAFALSEQHIAVIFQNITQQKQAEQQRQNETDQARLVLEATGYGVWDLDVPNNRTYYNTNYAALLGYQTTTFAQTFEEWYQLVHPDDLPQITHDFQALLAGQIPQMNNQFRIRNSAGEWQWLQSRGGVVARDANGNPTRVIGVVDDITKQKQSELELQKLAAIVENSPDYVSYASLDLREVYINPAGRKLVGYALDDPLHNYNPLESVPPQGHALLLNEVLPTVEAKGMWQGEGLLQHIETGTPIPVEATIFLITDPQTGAPIAQAGIMRDISERKQAERELQKLAAIVENSPDYIIFTTLDASEAYINPAGRELVGMTPGDLHDNFHVASMVYPEDLPTVHEQIIPQITQTGKAWTGDIRLRNVHTGTIIPTSGHVFLVKDPRTGETIAMAAIMRDMREQRRMEQELQKLAAIVQGSPDYMSYASLDMREVYVNAAGRRMVGYPLDAPLTDYDPLQIMPAETHAQLLNEIEPAMQTQGFWSGETRIRRLDTGAVVPVEVVSFVIHDPQTGEPIAHARIMRDISERKRAEQERLELQQRVIAAQRAAIHELSTPLLPLSKGVVALPIIGSVDTARAQQVMETLLEGIAEHKAQIAIVDITGVKVVDTQVAKALISTAQAVRLLGAQVVITGIQPRIAQTLVQLGVELTGIVTRSTLEDGIAYALKLR